MAQNVSLAGGGQSREEALRASRRNTKVSLEKYRERIDAVLTKPPPPDAEDYFTMGEEGGRPESPAP